MRAGPPTHLKGTLTPFLYPFLLREPVTLRLQASARLTTSAAKQDATTTATTLSPEAEPDYSPHLNPPPEDYSSAPFADACTLTLHAGSGGHGCISFLREKYIAAGPPNGGDGGSGGNIYIQAVRGETSLHKLARRGIVKAGRGQNGMGKSMGGTRGGDVVVQVPVGTVVREIWRVDPVAEEEERLALERGRGDIGSGFGPDVDAEEGSSTTQEDSPTKGTYRRDQWILYPGTLPSYYATMEFPPLPKPRRSVLTSTQPKPPIRLDLDTPMEHPLLLCAGATGGLGNPHFVTKSLPRPKFATRGSAGMRLGLQLELKLLADVGLVGLPNAGKSTLLRALSNSRTRVGNWAFTTLTPNIGTVVLDNHRGRPELLRKKPAHGGGEARTSFTIADIPGLIEDAHLDKGLGLGFLRHIERAAVLAFVVDLSAGDAVAALKGLWKEVSEYQALRDAELNKDTEKRLVDWSPFLSAPAQQNGAEADDFDGLQMPLLKPSRADNPLPALMLPPISAKPWFVVATKADLPGTRENFEQLVGYLGRVGEGSVEHPSGMKNAWRKGVEAVPVSAIRGEGVERIPRVVVDLLD